MRYVLASLVLVCVACGSDSTGGGPTISTLQNDNFTSGGAAPTFIAAFDSGEAAAVRLGPQGGAFTIRKVIFLFGGAVTGETVRLTIYNDPNTANPGTVLHDSTYAITPSDAAFQQIDLTAKNIHVAASQMIRVALAFNHVGLPSVAKDAAITNTRNLVNLSPGGWTAAETVAIDGDFIIRLEISTP